MKKLIFILILNIGIYGFGLSQNTSATWGNNGNTAWYSGANWQGNHYAGYQGNAIPNSYIATFTSLYYGTSPGINMGTGSLNLGGISIDNTRSTALNIGNSSSTAGDFRLYGSTINGVNNVIIRNNGTGLLTLQVNQLGLMTIVLGNTTENIINIDNNGGITISASIVDLNGSKNLTKAGAGNGILTLTNSANLYSGTTTINSGELRLNPANTTAYFYSQIALNGGTLSTANISANTVITSASTLKVVTSSTLALGSNVHSLKFSASNGITWTGATLTITGWIGSAGSGGTAGRLFVGSNNNGLTTGQLAQISFTGFPSGALILNTGEVVPASDYPPPTYYSKGSLPPDLTTSWNSNRDGTSGNPPSNFTSRAIFVIQNAHNMTTTNTWSISGSGSKLQIENGGTLTGTYAVTLSSATTFQIDNGGTYIHNNSAAVSIFSGTESFSENSTVEIKNWVNASTPIPAIDGSWGNLIITYNPGSAWNQSGNIINIAGNFTIDNSSPNGFIFVGNAGITLTINGDLNINSGLLTISNAGATANTFILNIGGSYNQTGGTFTPNVNTSSTLKINLTGSNKTFTQSIGTLTNAQINWTINSGASTKLNSNLSIASCRTFTVNGSLDCGTNSVSGAGSFILSDGATLKTANTGGINGSIASTTKTFSTTANYVFSCSTVQVTGASLPATVNNFTVDNEAGVKLSNAALMINGVLTINNGKVFIIEPGKQVTASGGTVLNGEDGLLLKSDASGSASFIDHGITGSGSARVERYLTADAWHYISSPISNATASVFTGDYLKTSDPSTTTGWGGWIIDTSAPLQVMRGYACWKPSGNQVFEAFTGNLNTGDQTFTVTNNGSGTFAGWHLVGNPYPSAVDLSAGIMWGPFEHSAYFWNQSHTNIDPYTGGGNYDVYPQYGGWGTHNQYVPSMQGFFIHNPSGNGSFSIPNSARVHSGSAFLKRAGLMVNGLIISVSGNVNGYEDKIAIQFNPEATRGYDPGYDAYKLWGLKEAPQLYTRIGDTNVTCNSLPFDKKNMAVGMGFICGVNGQYTLKADSMGTFASEINILLEDLKMGTTQDLRLYGSYTFMYDTLDDANRFVLHFSNPSFGVDDLKKIKQVEIYSFGNAIYVKSEGKDPETIYVYDLARRLLFSGELLKQALNRLTPNVAEGYYFVRVVTREGVNNQRVYIGRR